MCMCSCFCFICFFNALFLLSAFLCLTYPASPSFVSPVFHSHLSLITNSPPALPFDGFFSLSVYTLFLKPGCYMPDWLWTLHSLLFFFFPALPTKSSFFYLLCLISHNMKLWERFVEARLVKV